MSDNLIRLTAEGGESFDETVGAASESVPTGVQGDFSAYLKATNFTGLTSIDVDLEESFDPSDIDDDDADWESLASFSQITGDGNEKITVTTPHSSRLRIKVTAAAGSGSVDLEVLVAGVSF